MRRSILSICIIISSFFCVSAHQLDFYGKCNKVPLPDCTGNWNAISGSDSALYVVGNNGYCFISYHNGGVRSISTGTNNNLTGIQFTTNSTGYTWGENGTLLRTINGGINWTAINTNTSKTIDKVQFTDRDHGFFIVDSIINKTVNGGITWTKITSPTLFPTTDFHFFDSLNGQISCGTLIPSASGYIYQTNNGGATWNQIYNDTICFKKMFYQNNTVGHLYGIGNYSPILLETISAGTLWNITYSGNTWTLGSNVILHNNQTTFVSNEIAGTYIYGTPDFNTTDGIALGATNIYSIKNNGIEMLYVLSSIGLYRYIIGGAIYENINFITGIVPSASNPNNAISAGNTLRFKINITNTFQSTLINLNGKIRCNSPYITITDSLGVFGNVSSHTNALNTDDFEIQLANNIPTDYLPQFELMMGDPLQTGGTWNSLFTFPIVLSPFSISNVVVDDDTVSNSYGNNNGIAEPSETIEMMPYADNITKHYLSGMDGHLFTSLDEIKIWSDTLGVIDTVRNHSTYADFPAFSQNVPSTDKFVFSSHLSDTTKLHFDMIFTGVIISFQLPENGCNINEYNNTLYRWKVPFSINDSYPDPLSIKNYLRNYDSNFSIVPNPNNGIFILKIKSGMAEKITIEICNVLGERIYESTETNFYSKSIDISGQPEGIYSLNIISEKGNEVLKIIRN